MSRSRYVTLKQDNNINHLLELAENWNLNSSLTPQEQKQILKAILIHATNHRHDNLTQVYGHIVNVLPTPYGYEARMLSPVKNEDSESGYKLTVYSMELDETQNEARILNVYEHQVDQENIFHNQPSTIDPDSLDFSFTKIEEFHSNDINQIDMKNLNKSEINLIHHHDKNIADISKNIIQKLNNSNIPAIKSLLNINEEYITALNKIKNNIKLIESLSNKKPFDEIFTKDNKKWQAKINMIMESQELLDQEIPDIYFDSLNQIKEGDLENSPLMDILDFAADSIKSNQVNAATQDRRTALMQTAIISEFIDTVETSHELSRIRNEFSDFVAKFSRYQAVAESSAFKNILVTLKRKDFGDNEINQIKHLVSQVYQSEKNDANSILLSAEEFLSRAKNSISNTIKKAGYTADVLAANSNIYSMAQSKFAFGPQFSKRLLAEDEKTKQKFQFEQTKIKELSFLKSINTKSSMRDFSTNLGRFFKAPVDIVSDAQKEIVRKKIYEHKDLITVDGDTIGINKNAYLINKMKKSGIVSDYSDNLNSLKELNQELEKNITRLNFVNELDATPQTPQPIPETEGLYDTLLEAQIALGQETIDIDNSLQSIKQSTYFRDITATQVFQNDKDNENTTWRNLIASALQKRFSKAIATSDVEILDTKINSLIAEIRYDSNVNANLITAYFPAIANLDNSHGKLNLVTMKMELANRIMSMLKMKNDVLSEFSLEVLISKLNNELETNPNKSIFLNRLQHGFNSFNLNSPPNAYLYVKNGLIQFNEPQLNDHIDSINSAERGFFIQDKIKILTDSATLENKFAELRKAVKERDKLINKTKAECSTPQAMLFSMQEYFKMSNDEFIAATDSLVNLQGMMHNQIITFSADAENSIAELLVERSKLLSKSLDLQLTSGSPDGGFDTVKSVLSEWQSVNQSLIQNNLQILDIYTREVELQNAKALELETLINRLKDRLSQNNLSSLINMTLPEKCNLTTLHTWCSKLAVDSKNRLKNASGMHLFKNSINSDEKMLLKTLVELSHGKMDYEKIHAVFITLNRQLDMMNKPKPNYDLLSPHRPS